MKKKNSDVLGMEVGFKAGEKKWSVSFHIIGVSTVIGILIMLKQFGVW